MSLCSYLLALKAVLAKDGIEISNYSFVLSALIHASKIKNDVLKARLPIHKDLLKLILDQNAKYFGDKNQPYLGHLYVAIFLAAYYGLQIGEIAFGPHVIDATNVHIATNKSKLLFILKSSKTHCKGDKPQRITNAASGTIQNLSRYCPFAGIKGYIAL